MGVHKTSRLHLFNSCAHALRWLLSRSLTQMGTEKEDFVTLSERIGRKTGGVSFSPFTSAVKGQREPVAYLMARGKVMGGKAGDLLELIQDILLTAKLDDRERFKQVGNKCAWREVPRGRGRILPIAICGLHLSLFAASRPLDGARSTVWLCLCWCTLVPGSSYPSVGRCIGVLVQAQGHSALVAWPVPAIAAWSRFAISHAHVLSRMLLCGLPHAAVCPPAVLASVSHC